MKLIHQMTSTISLCLILVCTVNTLRAQTDPAHPNVIIIIADDLGVDAVNGYQTNADMPITPHLDSLRDAGIKFNNAWSAPKCTPSRATIMSGKYGNKTGVLNAPGNLDVAHTSLFNELESRQPGVYSSAVIGKWHISQPINYSHPSQHGVDYYDGLFSASVDNYYSWEKVTNGIVTTETEYTSAYLTTSSINWINAQTNPWIMWLAHAAPHSPYHVPPVGTYTSTPVNTNKQKYIAMIESMDYEIGRLIDNIPTNVLENTVILFIGDNGTAPGVIQNYPSDHSKGTLYQGGVHVPFFVSGKGVTRIEEEENALVHINDIYSTVLEIAGENLDGGIHNSMSFNHLLSNTTGSTRPYNFSEITSPTVDGWTIRNDQYKLIEFADGTQEFYDLIVDTLETTELIALGLNVVQVDIKIELENEANEIITGWSCNDLIMNGAEPEIDCGGNSCYPCGTTTFEDICNEDLIIICSDIVIDSSVFAEQKIIAAYTLSGNTIFEAGNCIDLVEGFTTVSATTFDASIEGCTIIGISDTDCTSDNSTAYNNIGCCATPTTTNIYNESISGDLRTIVTNNFPNHDYCFNPMNVPTPVDYTFNMDATPSLASMSTSILNETNQPARHYGVALNGVIFSPAPAAPFIFENTDTGQYNWDWVFEPINNQGMGMGLVSLDCASAHTGPHGYHYHGNMFEYAELLQTGISTTSTVPTDPIQVGWASDGFPILYRFGPDENGNLILLQPSYQFKYGLRPGDGVSAPCGTYNGKYTNDYTYIECSGDLDSCNGIERSITLITAQGTETFNYFYVITDAFPQIGRCLSGTPDPSFDN